MFFKIVQLGNNETIRLAVKELKKYLEMIDSENDYALMQFERYDKEYKDALWVGIDDSFKVPEVENKLLDDAISIDVKENTGIITGTNERAVLIAVYRYLRELGCKFIRPTSEGEIIPRISLKSSAVKVFEAASYRHRAVCIEGSVSYNDVVNFIEWMPKVALNGYYNQFRIPYTFYERWYKHLRNTDNFEENEFLPADAKGILNQSIREIKERGMLYHAIGHGWTCEPFGIGGYGWHVHEGPVDESISKNLALINGKREFFGGVPLNTNLCYSSPEVQETMVNAIVEYCEQHSEVDYLHIWLADATNNHCECDECKKKIPSDYYVQILNKIGDKLDEKGIQTRLVFLIYVDLFWAPQTEKLKDKDRFVLMFAPITRSYSESVVSAKQFDGVLPEYKRNQNKIPSSVAENIAHLKEWQKGFNGDSFDFDYHYMWDHLKDLGGYNTARVMCEDMTKLEKIGLRGMLSCQCTRAFYPHALGMNVMAQSLWDKETDFDKFGAKFFKEAYGESGDKVQEFMKKLSELSITKYARGETKDVVNEEYAESFRKAKLLIKEFKPVIEKGLKNENSSIAKAFEYLTYHSEISDRYLDMLIEIASGNFDEAKERFDKIIEFSFGTEKETHDIFDAYTFQRVTEKHVYSRLTSRGLDLAKSTFIQN